MPDLRIRSRRARRRDRYERDGDIGLDFARARMYSFQNGRFISPDPVGPDTTAPQTLNRYQYVLNNPLKFVDRDGRYEEEVHRDLTVALAYLVGFSGEQAKAIGNANQHIDENPKTNPERLLNFSGRAEWHFTSPITRGRHWRTFVRHANSPDGDPYSALGSFLHPQQDSFSHAGFDFIYGQTPSGFKDGIPLSPEEFMAKAREADQTQTDPAKAERMAADTMSWLLKAKGLLAATRRWGAFERSVPYSVIAPYIARWAVADGRKAKFDILQEMIGAGNSWRARQVLMEIEKRRRTPKIYW